MLLRLLVVDPVKPLVNSLSHLLWVINAGYELSLLPGISIRGSYLDPHRSFMLKIERSIKKLRKD